ncbi:EpsG family protein [Tenacibaculum sp. 190130A14a]|uniref:EpsG family protein n=1 Tax=Tenacibaculum polynesiense TaxID=3137857 RepID=A0ABM9PCU9_9FLAO
MLNVIGLFLYSVIPAQYYGVVFYNVLLFLTVGVSIDLVSNRKQVYHARVKKNILPITILIILFLFIGFRPLSVHFGDMGHYYFSFEEYARGEGVYETKDVFWHLFMKFCSGIMTSTSFFLVCAIIYTVPIYIACKRWFKENMYIPFLMFIASFSFFSYGTNGIRNGIATSLVLLGFSYSNKNWIKKYLCFTLGLMTHMSVIIPIGGYLLSVIYKKTKHYLYGWFLAIPLSLVLGSFWENLFASIGFNDKRLSYLTAGNITGENFAYTGFRWDFVLYSFSAIFAGYYFIFKKKFDDKVYHQLFNIYAVANAFWILVIRANFSNRFAYLSWFMMAVVIFYPFFKQKFFRNQNKRLAVIVILYFAFTYYMTS